MADSNTQQTTAAPEAQKPSGSSQPKESTSAFLFQLFCAVIFLGMIGLVSYNAFLRYIFRSSFPPSEEWARFLFIYITFFGAIEAFYHHKHICVDLVTDHLHGMARKGHLLCGHQHQHDLYQLRPSHLCRRGHHHLSARPRADDPHKGFRIQPEDDQGRKDFQSPQG